MCTVTYVPYQGGYILTSNRDVPVSRPGAIPPKSYLHGSLRLWYPVDPVGQGTWIVSDLMKRSLVLLNGAFEDHARKPYYRLSRGVILLQWMLASCGDTYFQRTDFSEIEPFTVIDANDQALVEYRWDGSRRYKRCLTKSDQHIWQSATLYTAEQASEREAWFIGERFRPSSLLAHDIWAFHLTAGAGSKETALCMYRNDGYATVSVTQVRMHTPETGIWYQAIHPAESKSIHPCMVTR